MVPVDLNYLSYKSKFFPNNARVITPNSGLRFAAESTPAPMIRLHAPRLFRRRVYGTYGNDPLMLFEVLSGLESRKKI